MSEQLTLDEFLWPNKYMLNFIGFWPIKFEINGIDKLLNQIKIILSIFFVLTLLVPQIFTCIVSWNDISVITGIGSITLEVGQLIFKLFYMLMYNKNFRRAYKDAQEFWLISNDNKERENFENLAKLARRITIVFFAVGVSNIFTFASASISVYLISKLQENKTINVHLPFELSYFGINTQNSPNFEIATFIQIIGMIYCAVGIIGFDATMLTLILHISGQFRLLRSRLRNYNFYKNTITINDCIKHHQFILRVAKETKALLSPVIFVQLMSSGIEICLCGYVLVLQEDQTNGEIAKYLIYTVTMFLQLLVWCWPGEVLIQESTAVGNAIFDELAWYKLSVKQQRDLAFVILRARKKCCVTALDFQVMSMSRLTEIFNTAASYFALLRSVCNK